MAADLSVYLVECRSRPPCIVFKQVWSPVAGGVFAVDREQRNAEDRYAVAVVIQGIIPVESHYIQLEFTRIALPSRLSCFHRV